MSDIPENELAAGLPDEAGQEPAAEAPVEATTEQPSPVGEVQPAEQPGSAAKQPETPPAPVPAKRGRKPKTEIPQIDFSTTAAYVVVYQTKTATVAAAFTDLAAAQAEAQKLAVKGGHIAAVFGPQAFVAKQPEPANVVQGFGG